MGVQAWVRPPLLPPVVRTWFSGAAPFGPLDWVVSKGQFWKDAAGRGVSYADLVRLCGDPQGGAAGKDVWTSCVRGHGLAEIVAYQPAGRFRLFQGIEAAVCLGLAAGLLALTVWWIRHRVQ